MNSSPENPVCKKNAWRQTILHRISRFPKTRLGLCGAVVSCSLKLMLYITFLGVCVPACQNGGTCVNSKCQCSQGLYEGNYCQTGKKV